MKIYNTLTSAVESLEPIKPPKVGIYLCGPTVYDVPHVGHARAAVCFDVLRRHLNHRGYETLFVRNFTDVDDRIIRRSNTEGVDAMQVALRFAREYDKAMTAINVVPPDIAPLASGHITEMIELIETLIERGAAYAAGDSVWFSVESFAQYGKLSGRSLDDMRAGERVDPDESKRNPMDFALWKGAKPDEPSWPSPWGRGRPGWHIECSAMAAKYLGETFDIHCGGADLIFPHHENEIAQSECGFGVKLANYWMHNGHVQIDGEKMSKSLKNYVEVREILEDYSPQVLRLFLLTPHYRSQIAYSSGSLQESKAIWERLTTFLRSGEIGEPNVDVTSEFLAALDDDLKTPLAIKVLHEAVTQGNKSDGAQAAALRGAVAQGLDHLGLSAEETEAHSAGLVGRLVDVALSTRKRAREAGNYAESDAIRDDLEAAGIKVSDSPAGPTWHRA